MSDFMQTIDKSWNYRPVMLVVSSLIILFVIWAMVVEIDQQVRGTGRVIPAGKTQTIQHLEGGIVRDILVREGDAVENESVLFHIGNQKAMSDLQEARIAMDALLIRQERLYAEQKNQTEFQVSEALSKSYPNVVRSEMELFNSRRLEFNEKLNGLEKQLRQKELKLDDLFSRIDDLGDELAIVQEQLQIRKRLLDSGAMSRSTYLETESRAKTFETRINAAKKEVPITKSELQEIYSNIAEEKQKRNTEITEDLSILATDINKLTERMKALQDQVTRTAVTSPIKGIVNKVYVNTIGGVVSPGQILADIVPIEEILVVEGKIRTNDRGKIYPGLPVTAKITAYDYTSYGGLKGTLDHISADSIKDNNGMEFYTVRVTLKTDRVSEDQPIHPGMTADLNILSGKVSVMEAILRPFSRLRKNALRDF